MATFQDFSLIKNEVKFIKNRNNIESISKAFIFMVLEKLYPDIELEDAITDGERDFCIDAYHIDESKKEINIFQFKYTEDFEIARKKDALKDRDISDFILKMERIWDKDRSVLRESNNKTANAIKEIWKALEEGFVDTKIWFISNYFKTISNKTKIKNTEKILKEKFRAELKIITLDNLITLIFQTKFKPINIKIQLKGRNYFEDSAGGIRALIGEINALNFLQSIMDDEENLKEEIFNENIRVYLRQSTKINKQIYLTIKKTEDNHKFFFYNNGITAICDEFNYTPTDGPVVDLKNFQIVNGGQTIHSLYEAYKNGLKENVKNIYLLLRICEVKNREIGQAIARYTNTQNPVRSRDVMSNDPIQIKLQQELNRLGWWYERKKYEFRERKDINQEKKID
ncbi:MAG: AIPR family protein, partial [candidate division WOR-3 bacterium]